MNSAYLIVSGSTGLVVLALTSYVYYRFQRRRVRQEQCYEALQRPCPICGAVRDSPCVDKQGTPMFLHWPRVANKVQSQPQITR